MFSGVMRNGILVLSAILLAVALLPDAVQARGGVYAGGGRGYGVGWQRPAVGAIAVGLGVGLGYGYYGHPFDDSYDRPYGYGEYAEYGPWAYRGYSGGGCTVAQQRVRTAYGPRWRAIRLCN